MHTTHEKDKNRKLVVTGVLGAPSRGHSFGKAGAGRGGRHSSKKDYRRKERTARGVVCCS